MKIQTNSILKVRCLYSFFMLQAIIGLLKAETAFYLPTHFESFLHISSVELVLTEKRDYFYDITNRAAASTFTLLPSHHSQNDAINNFYKHSRYSFDNKVTVLLNANHNNPTASQMITSYLQNSLRQYSSDEIPLLI